MDGVAVLGCLRPGADVAVCQSVESATGRRIKSSPGIREFSRPSRGRPMHRGAAGEVMGHLPVAPSRAHLSCCPQELPPGAVSPPNRGPSDTEGRPSSIDTQGGRNHDTATVQQTAPGDSPAGPNPLLDLLHGQDGGENRRRTAQGQTANLGPRRFRRLRWTGGIGRSCRKNLGQDRCEPLDDVVGETGGVHVTDARRRPSRVRRSPAGIMSTGPAPEPLRPGSDALLSGSRGAQCACRNERRTWRC